MTAPSVDPMFESSLNERLYDFVHSKLFQNMVLLAILAAAVLVGLETYPSIANKYHEFFGILDNLIIAIFTIEILLKWLALGRRFLTFFKDPWNVFDFVIVAVCFLPVNAHYVAVIRLARILRALRLISTLKQLQILVSALLKSIPSMSYVSLLMFLIFYIYAVLGTFIFGANDPIHFSSLGISLFSLFRVVTLEDWTDIVYTQMYGCENYGYSHDPSLCTASEAFPYLAPIFFVSLVILGTMIILNLFIGIVLNGMTEAQQEAIEEEKLQNRAAMGGKGITLLRELNHLTETMDEIKERMIDIQKQLEYQDRQQNGGDDIKQAS